MSTTPPASGQNSGASAAEETETETQTTETDETSVEVNRTPEEYAKRLKAVSKEAKTYRQELNTLKNELKTLQDEKLSHSGKKDELIEKQKADLKTATERADQLHQRFGYKAVRDAVKAAALKAGCQNPDALAKLLAVDDKFESIEVNEDYEVTDADAVKSVIEDARKEHPYLFGKAAPRVNTSTPNGKGADGGGKTGLEKMTLKEKAMFIAKQRHSKQRHT